jgi:Lrp/AsnC family transcriptional regulator, regulator for asnA, asnC and gidA
MNQVDPQFKPKTEACVDAIDRQILKVLQEDCRLSFNKIAARTGISVGTAYNRIKILEALRIVKGYTLLIDYATLSYPITTVIFVQAEGGHLIDVEKEIAEDSNVVAVYDVTGEFDAAIIAKFKDRNTLNIFIKHLAAMNYVKRTITNVSLNTVKEDFRLMLL